MQKPKEIEKIVELRLELPSAKFKEAFLASYNELKEKSDKLAWVYLGDTVDLSFPQTDFKKYVQALLVRETTPPSGFVCDTVYWAFYKDEMVGRISLRHELNDFLKKVGGHIGYIVHPKWRNNGIASWMLAEVLKTKRARSIGAILLTCDEANIPSEKTIVKNGGVYKETIDLGNSRPPKKHFWINLTEIR